MIEISFLTGELILAGLWLAVRALTALYTQKFDVKREAKLLLMYINLAILLRITFYPRELIDGHIQPLVFDPEAVSPFWINLEPFTHMSDFAEKSNMMINILGNILMFVPTGILLPLLCKHQNRWWKVIGTGMLMSLTIELLQLPFSSRATDIDDLILNTAGCIAGYVIFAVIRAAAKHIRNTPNTPPQHQQL